MDQANDRRNFARILSLAIAVIAATGWYLYFDQREQQRALSEDLIATKAKLEIEIQDLSQELNNSKVVNRELSELNKSLKADVAASLTEKSALQQKMQQDLESAIAANRELQQELETTAAAQQALQRELESTVTARQELQAELESQLAEQAILNQQIVLAIGASGELEEKLQQGEDRRRQLQQQIDAVSGDIEMKAQALSDADKRFAELNRQLEQTRQSKDKLKLTVAELSRQRAEESAHFARLQDALKKELNESRVEISQLKNRSTVIKLTNEVLFTSGSAEIRPEGKRVLSLIAESLNAYPTRAISIEGHTDHVPIGKHSRYVSNWELSAARALAAVNFFQQKSQVDPGRLQMVGLGEFHPVAGNDSAEGRAQNRRIEIKLLAEN